MENTYADFDYAAWVKVYVEDGDITKDLHQLFADELGISRQSAKRLCYELVYDSVFIMNMVDEFS